MKDKQLAKRILEAVDEVYMVPVYMEDRVEKAILKAIKEELHNEATASGSSTN